MAANLHVSISAEPILTLGNFEITNSMFTGVIVSILIFLTILFFRLKPLRLNQIGYFQNLVELFVETIYGLCRDIAGARRASEFMPLIATSILFILLNNWFGLLPGVGTIGVKHPVEILPVNEVYAVSPTTKESHEEESSFIPLFRAATADLNTTLALALISVVLTQYYGVKYQGLSYFTKYFNFKQGPIFTAVGFLEIISEVAKIVSFAFRLFGNIFAGEVLLVVIAFLVPVLLPVPFLGLEIFVGFVQALVFAMLTLVFINMATQSHH